MRKLKKVENVNDNIGTIDLETDPFLHGRFPMPFASCLYFSDDDCKTHWGADCVEQLVYDIKQLDECTLYAHNGGKFDFHYLLPWCNRGRVKIVGGRIASIKLGNATLIDSWLLIPIALAAYEKTEIDYAKFEEDVRESHKDEILRYLVSDCRNLLELVNGFKEEIGNALTIGQAAFKAIKSTGIKIPKLDASHDETFRPYYFGGRCECFDYGVLKGMFAYLDINSAYPYAMKFDHPTGRDYIRQTTLPKTPGPWFATINAESRGALPLRMDDKSLSFPHGKGKFSATGWEIIAGIQTGTLDVYQVDQVLMPVDTINFSEFVDTYYAKRVAAKREGDQLKLLLYKLLLNSGYGKFCQDPRKFKEFLLLDFGDAPWDDDYDLITDIGGLSLFGRSNYDGSGFYDVATGASITGFVRAMLWRAICSCEGVKYADTDSIICERYNLPVGPELGEWKIEDEGTEVAIAGKKLYAFKGRKHDKTASKGVKLCYTDIVQLAKGKAVTYKRDAPNYSVRFGARFIERTITPTGEYFYGKGKTKHRQRKIRERTNDRTKRRQ